MDLWVVAAAAGAGYIAKNLQNLSSSDKRESFGASLKYKVDFQSESTNFLQQLRDKTCPLRRLGINSSDQLINCESEAGLASYSGDALEKNEEPEDNNLRWIYREFADREVRSSPRARSGKPIGSKKRCEYIKPLNPLGSSLDAQLRREHEREEETMSGLVPSLSAARPVLVTNGTQIISRSSSGASFLQFEDGKEEVRRENGACVKAYDAMLGSTSLQQFESAKGLEKEWKRCSSSLGLSGSSSETPSQGHDRMRLFIIGMTVGILSAATASKNVVDKLNKQLKQTRNLVQDLHEELDMKDMLKVKELTNDSPLSSQEPNASSSGMKVNYLPKLDKTNENLELMSKIEAELEAELEMLERNMDSAMERISNVVELDSDFEPDIVQGDLEPMMGSVMQNAAAESGSETTDTTPKYNNNNVSQPPNYAVCPWELSMRLHELIESRLEERVKELETALGNTPNRFQLRSSHFQRRSSYSETRYSSSPYTPTCTHEGDKSEDGFPAKNFSSNYIDGYKNRNGIWDKHTWSGFMSNEDCRSEDDDDSTDESEMLMLKQIIERKKLGSRVVLEF